MDTTPMHRILPALLLTLFALSTLAGIHPIAGTPRTVSDPANVVDDRGAKLEIYLNQRATAQTRASTHQVVRRVVTARATDAIGAHQLGVVFSTNNTDRYWSIVASGPNVAVSRRRNIPIRK
jgi:hypothetical protein